MADQASLTMANPALNSARHSYISRSNSRASSRQQYAQAREFDPILRNLSPTTTLRAFSETDYLSPNDILQTALESSTTAQRTLGSKAAQTCLDVRSWAREMEGWEWPGTFDMPEPARKKQRMSTMTTTSLYSHEYNASEQSEDESEYWGSLPAATVEEYEQRSDEIVQQLEEIDVEELKDFVLSAHNEAGNGSASIDDSIGAIGAATDLRRLDDFTAIITATILQALPYLSRLNRLLDTWTIRLAILRQAPVYLKTLWQARADLDHGWASLAISSARGDSSPQATFTRGTMIEMQSVIERKLGSLGRKLDRFLDDLEGRPETVPDSWIEDMESLEQKYAEWIVRAERKILENDLRRNRWSRNVAVGATPVVANDYQNEASEPMRSIDMSRSNRNSAISARSPSNGFIQDRTITGGNSSIENQSASPTSSYHLTAPSISELARNDSNTIPSDQANAIVDKSPALSTAPSRKSSRSARHVPIILPYDGGDGQEYPTEGITGDVLSREGTPALGPSPDFASPKSEIPSGAVARKRAIFAGDIERTQSLQRATKTPVRPFEHASNAFARLFKTEVASPERSRSSSLRSELRRRSGSGKSDNGIVWGGRAPASPKKSPGRKSADSLSQSGTRSSKNELDRSSVAAGVDAPPVPELPAKSPRRSLQSPSKSQKERRIPSSPPLEETKNEPFPGFDFGEDWPLASPTKEHDTPIEAQLGQFNAQAFDDQDEAPMRSPRKPLESDSFDRLFVDSLPGTPDERAVSPGLPENLPSVFPEPPKPRSPVRHTGVPTVEASMLDSTPNSVYYRAPVVAQDDFDFSSPVSPRPSHIDLPPASSLPVPPNDLDAITPNSITSDTYSPEIQDARVSYFQMTSPPLSRTTSLATPSPQHTRQKSSHTSSPMQVRSSPQKEEELRQEDEAQAPFSANRSSILGIESQPRLEVKSIDLPRRKSSASVIEPEPQPPADALSSPEGHEDVSSIQSPPTIREERPGSPVSPLPDSPAGHELSHRTSNLSLVSEQASPAADKGVLNTFMAKRRGLGPQPNSSPLAAHSNPAPESDELDRHVSEVLQKLPAPIRFRSGATTPQPRTSEPRNYSGPRPKTNAHAPSRTSTGPGGLTLAPADPTSTRKPASSSASEPQVKLYHLTQAGREDPIKLFVRLVGEGQRVMVRVGGGWADLADYLRQYAEHHGSRTVSGEVDVKAVDSPATGGSGGVHPALRRQASGPLSSVAGAGRSSPAPPTYPSTPARATENADPSASTSSLFTPPVPPKSSSRPSTADSNRPGSRHGGWSELGGGGGSGKKELPENKARWVEGMVERVQKASAEKGKGGEKQKQYFSEMGTVGGTRRVVWRSGSAAGER